MYLLIFYSTLHAYVKKLAINVLGRPNLNSCMLIKCKIGISIFGIQSQSPTSTFYLKNQRKKEKKRLIFTQIQLISLRNFLPSLKISIILIWEVCISSHAEEGALLCLYLMAQYSLALASVLKSDQPTS